MIRAVIALSLALCGAAQSATTIPGAIRWDPWYGSGNVVSTQRTLGPAAYQNRMPFFGVVNSPYDVTINGNQQSTVDAEIEYAKNAGLKYWAYLWYPGSGSNPLAAPFDPMMNAWQLHQSSSHANDMNWCMMTEFSQITGSSWFTSYGASLIAFFKQSNYQTVLSGRPVWYINIDSYNLATNWSGNVANVASAISTFRTAVTSAGVATPYIILMYGTNASVAAAVGADATSAYSYSLGSYTAQPTAWTNFESSLEGYWSQLATAASANSIGMIPIAMDGFDDRPRLQNIVQWENSNIAHAGQSTYISLPTASQLTTELQDCVIFVNSNTGTNASKLILIYAWSECDEGGNCLMPHYSSSGPDLTTLNAVAAVSW